MRVHNLWAGATLALVLTFTAACGASPSTATSSPSSAPCANAGAPHHAYVVVQHLSGTRIQKCVGFTGDTIDGQALMDQSKVQYSAQTFSFGKAVCQVDGEPQSYTSCFSNSGPNWLLFVDTGGTWEMAQTGYTQITLHDKDAFGWIYSAAASPAPPPLPKEG